MVPQLMTVVVVVVGVFGYVLKRFRVLVFLSLSRVF